MVHLLTGPLRNAFPGAHEGLPHEPRDVDIFDVAARTLSASDSFWALLHMNHSDFPSSVITDASGTAKMAFGLVSDGFSPVDFLDLLRLLDEVVVRGRVVLVPSAGTIPSSMLQPLKPLFDAGALVIGDQKPRAIPVPPSVG